jgi:hypothetical protein
LATPIWGDWFLRAFARGGLNTFEEIAVAPATLAVRILDEQGQVLATHPVDVEG